MYKILFFLGILTLSFSCSQTSKNEAIDSGDKSQPNMILILTDDQGWGDLSSNGNTNIQTPNIDKLAETGVTFERFYVCAVCSPTRAEILTGRYNVRGGVWSTRRR